MKEQPEHHLQEHGGLEVRHVAACEDHPLRVRGRQSRRQPSERSILRDRISVVAFGDSTARVGFDVYNLLDDDGNLNAGATDNTDGDGETEGDGGGGDPTVRRC